MADIFREILGKAHDLHKAGEYDRAEAIYHRLLNRDRSNKHILYLLGELLSRKGQTGVAYHLTTALLMDHPDFAEAWNTLGIIYKVEDDHEDAAMAWGKCLDLEPDNHDALVNMATLYSDSGHPDKAMEFTTKALAGNPTCPHARWNHALALLSKRQWPEAWAYHEARQELEKWHKRDVGPVWDGKSTGSLLVHGEQGIGDEVMFASCLPDLIATVGAENITVECNAKVAPLIRQSFPVNVITEVAERSRYDWVVPLGSVPQYYRQKAEDFPGKPYLQANPELVAMYRAKLEDLGPGPYVGYSWHGGARSTKIMNRSIRCRDLPRLGRHRIALQYGQWAEEDSKANGLIYWPEACGNDTLAHQAALIAALDLVITVCTAIVHVAGALGQKCWVMVPATPSWRYGIEGDMPWYGSVKLYRQPKAGDWDTVKKAINLDYMGVFK